MFKIRFFLLGSGKMVSSNLPFSSNSASLTAIKQPSLKKEQSRYNLGDLPNPPFLKINSKFFHNKTWIKNPKKLLYAMQLAGHLQFRKKKLNLLQGVNDHDNSNSELCQQHYSAHRNVPSPGRQHIYEANLHQWLFFFVFVWLTWVYLFFNIFWILFSTLETTVQFTKIMNGPKQWHPVVSVAART